MLGGCSQPPPLSIAFGEAAQPAYQDRLVRVEGFVRLPAKVLVRKTMTLELRSNPDGQGRPYFLVVPLGDGPNQCEVPPQEFGAGALRLHAQDGSLVDGQQKIRVTARLHRSWTVNGNDYVQLQPPITIERAGPL